MHIHTLSHVSETTTTTTQQLPQSPPQPPQQQQQQQQPPQPLRRLTQARVSFLCDRYDSKQADGFCAERVSTGSARRRRERRLRSWWRHERMSIAAVLATVTHHSHSKVGTANDAPRSQKKVTSTEVGPAEYYELSSDDGRPTGRERPEALSEPWPQGKLLRHAGVGYEIVLSLDVPVPQMGEQLPNIVQFFAAQLSVVAEPVTEVPKILLDRTPQRLGDRLRQPQMVEQLVQCRLSCLMLRPSSLLPSRSTTFQFRVVLEEGSVEVFKVFSQDRIQQHFTSSRPLTFQFRAVEVFKALALDRVQQPLHLTLWARVFFALFPEGKKCGARSALGVGTECGL